MPRFAKSSPRLFLVLAAACAGLLLAGCASREERIQRIQSEAETALFENKPEEAIAILRKGLNRLPDANGIRIALSRALAGQGEYAEAAALLEETLTLQPEQSQLWVRLAEIRERLGDSEGAIQAYEAYLAEHPKDFLAWKALARESEKLGQLPKAIKAANQWNELTPSGQPALTLGKLYLASNNIPQARSWLAQAAAYEKDAAAQEALAELVRLETSLTQFQQAASWLEQYRKRFPNAAPDPRIQESKTVLDNWRQAREEIARAAAALEKERRELEEQRLQQQQQFQQQQANVAAAETSGAEMSEEADGAAGSADPSAGSSDQQTADVEKQPEALFGDDATVADVSEAAPAAQTSPPADSALEKAMAALEAQNYSQAVPLLWQALGQNPDRPELWLQLSRAYFEQGNWLDAESCILEARRRAPNSEEIAAQYSRIIAKTQPSANAVAEMKAIRRQFPQSPELALAQARALKEVQAAPAAVADAYQDFLQSAPRRHSAYSEATRYLQNGGR